MLFAFIKLDMSTICNAVRTRDSYIEYNQSYSVRSLQTVTALDSNEKKSHLYIIRKV